MKRLDRALRLFGDVRAGEGATVLLMCLNVFVLPLRWGLSAFAESGRVWYEGEESKKFHTGYGGGLMVQLVGTPMAFGGSIANGTEGIRFYFSGGYSF